METNMFSSGDDSLAQYEVGISERVKPEIRSFSDRDLRQWFDDPRTKRRKQGIWRFDDASEINSTEFRIPSGNNLPDLSDYASRLASLERTRSIMEELTDWYYPIDETLLPQVKPKKKRKTKEENKKEYGDRYLRYKIPMECPHQRCWKPFIYKHSLHDHIYRDHTSLCGKNCIACKEAKCKSHCIICGKKIKRFYRTVKEPLCISCFSLKKLFPQEAIASSCVISN